jgi:DNA-binding NtrC family response regulator
VNILFLETNPFIRDELREVIADLDGKAYFAVTPQEAIRILHTYPVDLCVLGITTIADIGLLQYINQHFEQVQIILTAEFSINAALSALKNSHFGVLPKPFTLRELRNVLVAREPARECV